MPDVLYILSPSYSGSTLLTFLLASHPEIATIGELKASAMGDIAVYHCSCGSLLTECDFWLAVAEQMERKGKGFSFSDFGTHFNRGTKYFSKLVNLGVRGPLFASTSQLALTTIPAFREQLEGFSQRNLDLFEVITSLQGGRVFLDGSKDPQRLKQFVLRFGDKVKVLHLIRDGRGVANSYMKHYQVGMRKAAQELIKVDRACDRVMAEVKKENAIVIKYEDLCREPARILPEIFKWLNLDPEPAVRRSEPTEFHILGNAMRLEFGKPIKIDEKWRRELTEDDLNLFREIAQSRNDRYEYPRK